LKFHIDDYGVNQGLLDNPQVCSGDWDALTRFVWSLAASLRFFTPIEKQAATLPKMNQLPVKANSTK
jgi:hypothetical protein